MYFIVLSVLALISGFLWFKTKTGNRYRLDVLTAVSSGAAVMFLVDSLYSYLEGEDFVEFSVNSFILSLVLVLTAIAIWLTVLAVRKQR